MTGDVRTQEGLPFKEAFRRVWVALPSATIRYVSFSIMPTVLILPIHLILFFQNSTVASLLAVPLLPPGGFLLLWGWVYGRTSWRIGGWLALVLGSIAPFYLT